MSFSSLDFKNALSLFASGVTVVTYDNEDYGSGITVSAFSSVSLDPPLVLVCINNTSTALASIENKGGFSVHILNADQKEISNTFAKNDESRVEYLKSQSIRKGATGAPHIPNTPAILDCSVYRILDGGDHKILLGQVEHAHIAENSTTTESPLVYFNRNYRTTKDL